MEIASMWASMAAWCTPTVLFCIMNIIIGTIFIASKSNKTKHHEHHHDHDHAQWNSFSPIARVSSFLERAKTVNLSSYTTTITTAAESQHQYSSQPKTPKYSSSSRLAQSIHFPPSNETRTPLRSSVSSPPDFSNGDEMSQSESERHQRSQPVRVPSLLERVKSVNLSVYNDNTFQTESEQICNSPGQLVRGPSLIDRIKSFKISSAFKPGTLSTQLVNFVTEPAHNPEHHVIKSKPVKTSATTKPPVEMKKSRSEMRIDSDEEEDVDVRRPATARARQNADDDEFNLKADDFISRFKQQLKLQRVESLVRFRDMLNRGT